MRFYRLVRKRSSSQNYASAAGASPCTVARTVAQTLFIVTKDHSPWVSQFARNRCLTFTSNQPHPGTASSPRCRSHHATYACDAIACARGPLDGLLDGPCHHEPASAGEGVQQAPQAFGGACKLSEGSRRVLRASRVAIDIDRAGGSTRNDPDANWVRQSQTPRKTPGNQ